MLRNIGLETIKRGFVMALDADSLIVPNIYQELQQTLLSLERSSPNQKQAYIIPAFQTTRLTTRRELLIDFPKDKQTLVQWWQIEHKVEPFNNNARVQYQRPTDFPRWQTAQNAYEIKYSFPYEPSLVHRVPTQHIELFAEKVVGYGPDKPTHALGLAGRGYKLLVLPNVFTIHIPHHDSPAKALSSNYGTREWMCVLGFAFEFMCRLPDQSFCANKFLMFAQYLRF